MVVKTTALAFIGLVVVGIGTARAQDPPTQPPTGVPVTPVVAPVPPPPVAPAPPPRVTLTDSELRSRRDAIFVMEGTLGKMVTLAANETQREIQAHQPNLKISMFSPVLPTAHGNYLEDYGVFFQVRIPTYIPSVVGIIETLSRDRSVRPDGAAQPTALTRTTPEPPLDPDALYVDAVQRYLVNGMLDHSKALDLRPNEWLTVSARGDDGAPGQLSEPSILVLRVKGSDLIDFLAGRISKDEVRRRVELRGYSSR